MSSLMDPMSNKTLIVRFDLWFRYKSPMDGSVVSLEDSKKIYRRDDPVKACKYTPEV